MIGSDIGHYKIIRLLGKGGMGEVYLADDTRLQRQVALKILSADVAADPDRRERFAREARAAAALNHPNIVTIHSVEEVDGRSFLTLEYIEGRTLAEILPPDGLPIDRILSIGIALADAVGAAHQRGITHRDLKPANVMMTSDGRVKVLDFGLAKLLEELQPAGEATLPTKALTGEGRIIGTVAYMAPEQAEGKTVDHRSDVFSLGVMLYEMAVGDRPFKGETQMSVLSSILRDTPPSITDLKHELPRDLAKIIRRCLAKDPEDRYQTAKDLRNDLRALRDDLSSGDRDALLASATSVARPLSSPAVVAADRSPWRRVAISAAILVVAVAAFVGWRTWSGSASGSAGGAGDSRPFASLGLSRLTTTGTAGLAAVSADGRYVAHVVTDERGQGLWLRQVVTSSNVEIVPSVEVRFAGITFSPDNNYVLYVTYPRGENYASLHQVPVLGGGTRQLVYDIDSAPTFSPDGSRFAFVRGYIPEASAIMVADADGKNVRELARRATPLAYEQTLQTVAWSPDGSLIAAAAGDQSMLSGHIALIDAVSGQERLLGGSDWRAVRSLAWLPDGSGLVVNAQEAGGERTIGQLWAVTYPAGAARRITSDLSSYAGLSLSRDGRTLVTVRGEQRATIAVSRDGSMSAFQAITNSAGADDGVLGVAWATDGRLLYTSTANGNSDIWIMNADGTSRVQLTTDRADDRVPMVTPDGRYVVFVSERGGSRGVWRMDPSGNNQMRLGTDVLTQSPWTPYLSGDGRWVTYTTTSPQIAHVKLDIESGMASPVFETPAGQPLPPLPDGFHDPMVSADGRTIVGHYIDPALRAERIAVLPLGDPSRATLFPTVFVSAQLSRDGRSLIFTDNRRSTGNLWRQAIAGGAPVQLTPFSGEQIFRFAFTADGKQVALSRGSTISDVVLMTSRDESAATR